jgi:hypothetical protein
MQDRYAGARSGLYAQVVQLCVAACYAVTSFVETIDTGVEAFLYETMSTPSIEYAVLLLVAVATVVDGALDLRGFPRVDTAVTVAIRQASIRTLFLVKAVVRVVTAAVRIASRLLAASSCLQAFLCITVFVEMREMIIALTLTDHS